MWRPLQEKKILFQRSGCQGALFPLFLCQAPWEPTSPIFISWTFHNSTAYLIPVPPSISSSPAFSKHRLIPDFIPPLVQVSPPLSLMCANVLHTHSCSSLHPWISPTPSLTGQRFPPLKNHFWFQVSSFLFSINPFIVLHQAFDSVIPPKQTHSIFTLLYLLLKPNLLLSPAPIPSKPHCLPSCTVSNTMNFIN